MSSKIKIFLRNLLKYCIAIMAIAISLFPIVWIVLASIKSRVNLFAIPPAWFFNPTTSSYQEIFFQGNFARYLLNSFIIVGASTALATVIGSVAAYSFARFKIPGGDSIIFWILSTRMFPAISVIIPFFLMMQSLNLLDTHAALIIIYTVFNLPLVVWTMRAYFREIPIEVEESARIDGLSTMGVFRRITIPLAKAGLIAAALLCVILTSNEFMFAFILTSTNAKTMPVATVSYVGARGTEWGKTSAAATSLVVPMVIILLLVQKYFIKGITFGAVKE